MNSFGMQKAEKSVWIFLFLKWGPVQTPQGALGAGPAGSLRLIAASMGPAFPEWHPQISNPPTFTAIYWVCRQQHVRCLRADCQLGALTVTWPVAHVRCPNTFPVPVCERVRRY